jgi:hypothetical protein
MHKAVALLAALLTSAMPATSAHATVSAPLPEPRIEAWVDDAAADHSYLRCATVAGACRVETRRGYRMDVLVRPQGEFAGARVRIERSWRQPGTTRLIARAPYRATLRDAAVAATVPLARVMRDPGLWCLRAVLDTTDGRRFQSQLQCVRWTPPVEIGWAGDTVVGSSWGMPPMGGVAQLAQVHDLLRAPDLMIGNYEGTLSRGGTPRCSGGPLCFIFQAPPERARNLAAAEFDVMNLANNHGLDMGADARQQTVDALDGVGVEAAGLPGAATVMQVKDTRVAIVGFSPYPGTTNMRDPSAIRALVRAADRQGDVVVAAFHAGLEGPRGAHVPYGSDYGTNTRAAVHAAVDAGADVVFGSGPHVVRGVERYRGAFIVYSSGNFAGWHNFALGGLSSQSGVVRVTFDGVGRTRSAVWDAVVIDAPGIPRPDRSGRVIARIAALSRADFGRAGARFARDGSFR